MKNDEYQIHEYLCNCGNIQRAAYPPNVAAPIQFGGSIAALVSYFNVFQYVPYARLKQLCQHKSNF